MTLSPEAREEVLTQTERRENGLRANLDEVATLAHQMIAIVRRGALRPDPQTGWLEPAPVEPAQPASRGLTVRLNEKALEAACEAVLAVPDHPGDKQKIRDAIATYIKVDLKDRAR